MVESLNLLSDCKIKLSNEEIIRQGLKSRVSSVDDELDKRNAGFKELMDKIDSLSKEKERKEQFILDIESRMASEIEEKKALSDELISATKRLAQINIELNEKETRLNMLRAMEQSFEGYSKSVKEIMQRHKDGELKNAKIYGPVSKLISADAEYMQALEAALGGSMQNIVVEDEEDAKKAIKFLKNAKCGRATFMPVSAVCGSELDVSKICKESGFLGLAHELVSYDAKYGEIIKNLLGKTVVIENMDQAISVSRKYKNTFRIVTLGGELFNVGGSISGGSSNRHASLMGREKEIKKLEQDATALKRELELKNKELDEFEKKHNELEFAIAKSEDMLRENKEILIVVNQEIAHNKELSEDLSETKMRLEKEKAEIMAKVAESESSTAELTKKIAGEETVIAQKRAEINKLEQEFEAVMIKKQRIADRVVEITVEKSAIEKDIEVLDEKIAALMRDDRQNRNNAELRNSEINDIKVKNEQFKTDIENKQENILLMNQKTDEYRMAISALLGEKSDFEEKSRAMQLRSKELRENVYQLTNDFNRIETKKVKLEVELENTVNRLWDEYELTHSDALAYKKDDLGTNVVINRRIAELKGKIRELGNVNVDAIEEFKSVKERYEFLTGQRDDLEKAKADLLKIIEEMTKVMKKQFEEKFIQINKFFKSTFVELFGGGSAELTLTDPQNVLECGINIDVQPPGKKLQSLSLLSGGERALSAIALLFAILKTRPTPFCFLDEIEAALDDVNVYRFADYVKNYSKDTQFIIVTHRRGTMESADVIYGVTMQEKGVSKLLQLNINEIAG